VLDDQYQGLDRLLPLGRRRERLDEFTAIAKAAQYTAIRELNRVVEALFPPHFGRAYYSA
jgi:hypothetical protein